MNSLNNRVQLIGRLGMDPEVREFGEKKKMARFQLATSEKYKNSKGEYVENTQWHSLVIWGNQVEVAQKYLKKGSEIALEGKLQYRQYEDGEGKKQFITEINVNDFLMLRPPSTK
ncbi:MAG: single-stranded DNA-binding protein [Salibacteraceae bacterium]